MRRSGSVCRRHRRRQDGRRWQRPRLPAATHTLRPSRHGSLFGLRGRFVLCNLLMLHQRQLAAPGKAPQLRRVHPPDSRRARIPYLQPGESQQHVAPALQHHRIQGVPGAPAMLGFRFSTIINTRASCSARRPGFPYQQSIGLNRHAPIRNQPLPRPHARCPHILCAAMTSVAPRETAPRYPTDRALLSTRPRDSRGLRPSGAQQSCAHLRYQTEAPR